MADNHKTLSSFKYDKLGEDRESLRHSLSNRLIYSMGKDPITATHRDWLHTTAYSVRERLIERWIEMLRIMNPHLSLQLSYRSFVVLTRYGEVLP